MADMLGNDLNELVKGAVQARVEAATLEAFASDGAMQAMVIAALNTQVSTSGYDRDKKTLLTHLLRTTIEELTKKVVAEEIGKHEDQIRAEVRKALEQSIGVIADSLVDGFVANAAGRYASIKVEFAGS